MLDVNRFIVGPLATNCYLLRKDSDLIIIDPGSGFKRIKNYIEENNLNLNAILLTHGHFDHIGAVDKLVKHYHCDVYLNEEDWSLVKDTKYYDFKTDTAKLETPLKIYPLDKLTINTFTFAIYNTPGHTNGSICLKIENHLFTGDTLFHLGVGRTDLYGGSEHKLRESLTIFSQFTNDTLIHPGHEEESTIGFELQNNPYLNR